MANFSGQPAVINRMLGFLDADDPTNLPIGLSAQVRNCAFELTSVRTRDGINQTMAGDNPSPITGLIGALYTPQTAQENFFQLPMVFDYTGALQYEQPVGTGFLRQFKYDLFTPPPQAHMIACQTYDKVFAAFSNLLTPLSTMAVVDPKTLKVWPYGMKPFGWTWVANTPVLVGEMATPSSAGPSGNGHTYRCIQAGKTGAIEPVWPLGEGVQFNDGTAQWQEFTAVMANRLPAPPALAGVVVGGGTFPGASDIYFVFTYRNAQGETIPSTPVKFTNPAANSAFQFTFIGLNNIFPMWIRGLPSQYVPTFYGIYTAVVATGAPAPPLSAYKGITYLGVTPGNFNNTFTAPGASNPPPTVTTARVVPGQLPTPDTAPVVQRIPTAGPGFPAGRDVYVAATFTNSLGETKLGPASSIVNTALNDQIQITMAQPLDDENEALYTIVNVGLYEADVPTGAPAPDETQFSLIAYVAPGTAFTITASAAGPNPPTSNTTGPAGNIQADTETGGINGTQGFRYMAIMYMNQFYTLSGFTAASVVPYIVDEDGFELAVFNVATGPNYVLGRAVAFGIADGTTDGPFWWIGNPNLQIPSVNFVYPQTITSATILQTSTFLEDNVSTSATFNFTDQYLQSANNATDRLKVIWPNQAVHCMYAPSVDRIFQSGVPGYYSGWWVSLAADPESYYKDTSFISVGSDDGERSWGTVEYRGTVFGLRERSGFTLSANPNNPQSWTATKRWSEVGPCGPRAFDACGMFMIFVHRSGIYRYTDTTPDLMTKEIPNWWRTVNWLYAHTICVKIDHERHEVHILVPVGNSTVPNQEIVLNYLEGWQDPIHFSVYSGKEISTDACRKYSINDVQAWVCDRIERKIDYANYPYPYGADGLPFFDKTFAITQFVYGSSAADGAVHAITPGVFSDNGAGIDCVYETVCPQTSMALIKIEGFSLNARGQGTLFPYFLAGRDMLTGYNQQGNPMMSRMIACRPIDLDVEEDEGLSRMVPSKINERWRMRYTNGKVKDSWFSLKWLAMYQIPFASARPQSQGGG